MLISLNAADIIKNEKRHLKSFFLKTTCSVAKNARLTPHQFNVKPVTWLETPTSPMNPHLTLGSSWHPTSISSVQNLDIFSTWALDTRSFQRESSKNFMIPNDLRVLKLHTYYILIMQIQQWNTSACAMEVWRTESSISNLKIKTKS